MRSSHPGYNDEVSHGGRVFHIQTEDRGSRGCVCTEVFHHGAVVAARKVDYSKKLPAAGRQESFIARVMQRAHRAAVVALKGGEFKAAIARIVGGPVPASDTGARVKPPPVVRRERTFPLADTLELPAALDDAPADSLEPLVVGASVQLRNLDAESHEQTAMLVGWWGGRMLIVRPDDGARALSVRSDCTYAASYVRDGIVYEFETAALHGEGLPESLVLLAYPAEVKMKGKRECPRLRTAMPAKLTPSGSPRRVSALIVDLSSGGCRVSVASQSHGVAQGRTVELRFRLPGERDAAQLAGVVRRVSQHVGHDDIGIQFVDSPAVSASRQAIAAFVDARLSVLASRPSLAVVRKSAPA